jgi:hypothetical protein
MTTNPELLKNPLFEEYKAALNQNELASIDITLPQAFLERSLQDKIILRL